MKIAVVCLMAVMLLAVGCNCTTKSCCGTCKNTPPAVKVEGKCTKCPAGDCKCKPAAVKCTKCGDGACKCEKK